MNYPNQIKTISSATEFKLKEKSSLFIGMAFPVSSELEATEKLNEVRKKYFDATHNCYAFKIVNGLIKYSDDGEPNGTAGIRILNAINHFDFNNVLVIVTRYFGGIKLGVGPLGKAYYDTAYECLNKSEVILKKLYNKIVLTYQFELSNFVHRTISKYNALIEKNLFEEEPQIICMVPSEVKNKFIEELTINSQHHIKIQDCDLLMYK
ncbi:IMPACT family protein [Rosettibacter firmus]|uniref:IMPACT family protein n=1 Tax=Rosettibacter firmus TaxID=3111522 RepID=UPI00336C2FDF